MLVRASGGSSGGGGCTLVEGTQTINAGTNTITVSGLTNIRAFMYAPNWAYEQPSYAYIDNDGNLQSVPLNASVINVTDISGNTVTILKSSSYPLVEPLKYTAVGE